MKLAFLILTHKSPDSLFIKLLDQLSMIPDVTIAIHHDYSQSNFDDSIIEKYHLHIVKPYHKTKWGHISKMSAICDTYKKIFEVTPVFDWLITISANCFPIKPIDHILNFFANSKYDFYMESHTLGYEFEGIFKWHYKTLFTRYLFSIPFVSRKGKLYKRAIRIPVNINKTPFKDYKPYTGADWYFVNNKAAKRILDADIANHPLSIYVAQQNLAPDMNASPDETIIQTFLKNQADLKGHDNYYRYINWHNTKDWHPNTLTMEHWEDIQKSDALYARKFDAKQSKELIEKIEIEILNKQKF